MFVGDINADDDNNNKNSSIELTSNESSMNFMKYMKSELKKIKSSQLLVFNLTIEN